ncbi:hypothetical protein, partial [Enterobacter hormaechei]
NTDDLFVGKTLLHGDVLMWLMKTLLTSGCTNQRGAGQGTLTASNIAYFSLPTNAQSTGSKIGLQRYSSSSATVRMTNLSNSTIEVASGQAVQVNVSGAPLITSAISTPSRVFRVTALPTAGKWTSGDILILISPGTTIKYGWSCSQSGDFAGTPPTFQVIA